MRVIRFARRPPPDLQIHHGVDDRVVAVDAPGSDQLSRGIVELLQPLGRAQSAGTILRIFRLTKRRHGRVEVEKARVVVLSHLLAKQTRIPKLGPATEAFVFGFAVKLPQLANPEVAGPVKALLFLPLAALIIAFGKKAQALFARQFFWRCL